jgi:tetratricopeptide (TPR) repeat protein
VSVKRRHATLLTTLVAVAAATEPVHGQRTRRTQPRQQMSAGSIDPLSVRAESASALIQARRYQEAATVYRWLLQRQPGNFEWRLNYARALARGGAYRAAEVELRDLSARAPHIAVVEELLRSVRANIEPTSKEAAGWVASRPSYLPYRLALARAYVRERRPRSAAPHFNMVLARDPSPALFAEAADAHAAARDRAGAAKLYRRAVDGTPSDVSLRRSYARALAANRQYAAALEQYDVLGASRPDPILIAERAEVRLQSGDAAAAERDLDASIALAPTPEAYTLLGDIYRWSGRFKRARFAYGQALALHPGDRRAAARVAQLTREERPDFGFASLVDEEVGLTVSTSTTTDNVGFVYTAGEARLGVPLGPGTVLGLGVEPRVVYERPAGGVAADSFDVDDRIVGVAAGVGMAHTFQSEDADARIAGRVGAVTHSSRPAMPLLAAGAVMTYRNALSLSLESTAGPAYTNLMALALTDDPSVLPTFGPRVALLRSRTFAVAVAVPFGIADAAVQHESMWLSDGNTRSAFEASIRLPLAAGLSLLYSGGSMGFAERSTLYWDPREYVSHALGFELGLRTDEGLAFTARVLPGVGRAVEGLTAGDPTRFGETEPDLARFAGQFEASIDLSVRHRYWETALGVAFATGRSGGYQLFDGNLRVRYTP